mgnify:CR=1 FL=1
MTPTSDAAATCSRRRIPGISDLGTAGSNPPASPSVMTQYVTSTPAAVTFVLLKLVGAFAPLRVSLQQELEGLDISQHGEALQ